MAEPRKIFRIEETAVARHAGADNGSPASLQHAEIMQALRALAAAIAAPAPPAANANGGDEHSNGRRTLALQAEQLVRIAHELEAVTAGTAQATQKILAAAEEIDQHANTLSAAFNGRIEQGLALDISDLVIRIFEACNFQDLIGQRVAKVTTTLEFIEDHIDRALDEIKATPPASSRDDAAQYLHGPRLDSDNGHLSQSEIDALFGC